ncbi:glycosyltransferase family 4 protein [Ancylobacter lacus]|uniref:glycosyltransferase family 4 protein n=1 Tax=Ancylobacter lacus TaxID=2579970 RepID=UPI001BCE537F|nr:glycosyltransferase family 4 protein [Ancylobacter lacus]MBS7538409.1 glycosyltransferase family 4 protein [Ancylobacter lacus]
MEGLALADPRARAPRPGRGFHLLLTADAVGGVFQHAVDLARGLAARGVTTTLALLGPAPQPAQRASAAEVPGLALVETGLPLDWLADGPEPLAAAARALAALAVRHDVDIVHLNSPPLALAPYPVPVVVGVHSCLASWWRAVKQGPAPEDFAWRTRLTGEAIATADAVVCPSHSFADTLAALYGRRPDVVWNGRTLPEPVDAAVPPDHVVATGRLWDAGKDIATLALAAGLTRLPVAVAGPLRGPNGAAVDTGALRVLGSRSEAEVRAVLAHRPIFASTALYEPFGLGVLEAAQAGCALVLSDIPTFRELWGGAALFVPPRRPEAFARAFDELDAEPSRRAALGEAARERAARYGVEPMAAAMAALYRRLLFPATADEEAA